MKDVYLLWYLRRDLELPGVTETGEIRFETSDQAAVAAYALIQSPEVLHLTVHKVGLPDQLVINFDRRAEKRGKTP
jgi:hypothetical protein